MASNLRYRDYESPTHPMADFLTKQLPMMIMQHKQNKANKIHEKDMAQFRLDGQKEVTELNNQLSEKRMMTESKLKNLASNKDRALKNLDQVNHQLLTQNIVAGQYGALKEKTEGGEEIIGKLDADSQRNFNFAQQEYNTVEEGILAANEELTTINEQLRQSQAVMGGIQFGKQKALEIPDFNADDELNALDVLDYFKVKNAGEKSLEEANQILAVLGQDTTGMTELNKHGFNIGFKSAQEAFYKPIQQSENIKLTKAKTESYIASAGLRNFKANATEYSAEEVAAFNGQMLKKYNTYLIPSKGMDPLNNEFSDLPNKPAAFVATAKNFKDSPVDMFREQTDMVTRNLEHTLLQVEDMESSWNPLRGLGEFTDNTLEGYLYELRDTDNAENKRNAMYKIATYLVGTDGTQDNIGKVSQFRPDGGRSTSLDSFLSYGTSPRDREFLKHQLQHFLILNEAHQRVLDTKDPGGRPSTNGLSLGELEAQELYNSQNP